MVIDTVSSANRGALKYLRRGKKSQHIVIAAPKSVPDPYQGQGSHPDIVQRVWDELGADLPSECRCLVYGTPALVHDRSGVIIAICNGTQYNLRLTADDLLEASAKGASTRIRWSDGTEMDSTSELGADWIFGGWFKDEERWYHDTYQKYGSANYLVHRTLVTSRR
jgi:hypothetical protein